MRRDLDRLGNESFDVLVIGGGVHGAWIAWDASLRGLSVALIDKGDFASGASSNSLKIVHGGLRYLQTADFRRMRESIRERSILMRVAPHLVSPLPFLIPLYGHGTRGPEALRMALAVTDLIGFDRNRHADEYHRLRRGRVISADECREIAPHLDSPNLTGGAVWDDAQMDNPERMVLSILHSAAQHGAMLANYVEAMHFHIRRQRVVGIRARDVLTDTAFDIQATVVVNATGAWESLLAERAGGRTSPFLLSKAMNIAVWKRFDRDGQYGVGIPTTSTNGHSRLLFATPWRDHTLIGTSHLPCDHNAENFRLTEHDVEEFLREVNTACPDVKITPHHLIRAYAGLLPAVGVDRNTNAVTLSTRHRVERHRRTGGPAGLISVTSIKFTTARLVAEEAVDAVFAEFGFPPLPSATARTPLYGGDVENFDRFLDRHVHLKRTVVDAEAHQHLARTYGTAMDMVLRYVAEDPALAERVTKKLPVIKAEVVYAIREEMAWRLPDVVFRRTDLGMHGLPNRSVLKICADFMVAELGWSRGRRSAELEFTRQTLPPVLKKK